MDYKDIKDLIKAVSDSKLTSFEMENKEISIKMNKEAIVSKVYETQNSVVLNSRENDSLVDEIDESSVENSNIKVINSPMVGTFYNSPSPDKDPYVVVGSKVKKGDTLCIIEAMKLMNEIESDFDGEIIDILVKNEEAVEYGQPIYKIDITK